MREPERVRLIFYVFRIILTVIYSLVILVFLDLIVGRIFLQPSPVYYHPYHHHGLKTNFSGTVSWGDGAYQLNTDALGFKSMSTGPVREEPEKHRIIVAGDSFTEGVGLPYEKTFVGILSQKYGTWHHEFVNAGVMSFSPKLHYLRVNYLWNRKGYRVDELIVFIDVSDIQDEIFYEHYIPGKRFEYVYHSFRSLWIKNSLLLNYIFKTASVMRFNQIVEGSYGGPSEDAVNFGGNANFLDFNAYYNLERGRWVYDSNVLNSWGEKGLSLAVESMDALNEFCRSRGVRIHVAVYPWKTQIDMTDKESLQRTFWRRYCRERNILFIDLFPVFINEQTPKWIRDEYFIPGDIHWNENGHRVIADYLFNHLKMYGVQG